MLPSPTKCEKAVEIEAVPDEASLFYYGTTQDMEILKENAKQEKINSKGKSNSRQNPSKVSVCIRRKVP